MYIQHEQFISLYNSDKNIFNKLLDKNLSVNTFCNRIDKIALKYSEYGYVDEYKMKGDIFEIFAEAFFKIMGTSPSIGVYNYTPIHIQKFVYILQKTDFLKSRFFNLIYKVMLKNWFSIVYQKISRIFV